MPKASVLCRLRSTSSLTFSSRHNPCRTIIRHCARPLRPLTSVALLRTTTADQSFTAAKHVLAEGVLLMHPLFAAQTQVMAELFGVAVGHVLQQFVRNKWQPPAFFSQELTPPETRHSTFGRELFPIYATIKHFRYLLECRKFHACFHGPETAHIRGSHQPMLLYSKGVASSFLPFGILHRSVPCTRQ